MQGYSSNSRALGTTVSVAFPFVTGATTAGGASAGSAILGAFGGPIGIAVTGITFAIGHFVNKWKQRAKQKEFTTDIVNEAEPYLQQNLAAWQQSSKTRSEQAQAISNFNAVWGEVVRQCSVRELGKPGEWCVEDRASGGKHDWFMRYLSPIENDPNVQADATMMEGILPEGITDIFDFNVSGGVSPILLIAGAGLVLFGVTQLIRD